jgi:hypothetical protein
VAVIAAASAEKVGLHLGVSSDDIEDSPDPYNPFFTLGRRYP